MRRKIVAGNWKLHGTRAFAADLVGAIAAALRDKVWPLLESMAVRPVIHSTFAAADAAQAHALMESNRHIGKIVLPG